MKNMNYSWIGTNIRLRPTQIEDAEKSSHWLNDPLIQKFLGISKPITPESRKKFLKMKLENETEKNFSIIVKNTNEYIGNVYLYNIDQQKAQAEVGIFIGEKSQWGQGFATEAIGIIIQYAFHNINLKKVYLSTLEDNVAAIKCYQKAGFQQTQKKDNLLFFELINNE
jgi:RimJ/RimL family protein N-acetyltransferase